MASLRSALWRINRCGHQQVTADAWALRLMPDIVVDLRESTPPPRRCCVGPPGGDVRVDELAAGDLLPGWYDEWVVAERSIRQLRLHAPQKLCEQRTDEGREQAGADDVEMRARVISTVNDTPTSTSAAATIDGIVDAVCAAVGQFLADRPVGTGGARFPQRKPRQTEAAKANSSD